MPTCGDLISECSAQLHGWGSTQDRLTPLSVAMTPTATSFTVQFVFGQSVGITPGVVEIDAEQVYVTSVDPNTGVCQVAQGFGRGYNGTVAASHSIGAKAISRPKFPRIWLFKQLNEQLSAVYPYLFQVKTFTTTVTYPSNQYTLPFVPLNIIDVQWQDPIGNWERCWSYSIDPFDGTFRLGDGAMIGRPLRILYSTAPGLFTAESDDFVTVTGLPATAYDVLTLGVVAKQVPGLDISRAQLSSVEQSDRSRVVPPNSGINVGKYIMAEYKDRLKNEAQTLRTQYRSRMVRVF